jgi:hypothetical protein
LVSIGSFIFFRLSIFIVAVTTFVRRSATCNIWIFLNKSLYNSGLDEIDFRIVIMTLFFLFVGPLLQQNIEFVKNLQSKT